jgi:5-(carboxyamino)imidazole ribonucleotide synthase
VLHITQHRLREKTFLSAAGLPVADFSPVKSIEELRAALALHGYPAILKSADFGYDGKGQYRIDTPEDIAAAWAEVGPGFAVLESVVPFDCEVSVVGARGLDGSFAHYGVIENDHKRRILDLSISPARVSEKTKLEAIEIARTVLEELDVVGVLCVEFFVLSDGSVVINELAPRPHNSGHLTFDACITSQFEQQLRAVCGLHLGSTEQLCPAAMANILGDLWSAGEPNWSAACSIPTVKLHLYGKMEPRPGRKMGHLTALGAGAEETVLRARAVLLKR